MTRLMSVSLTEDAVRERRKTVTRRVGWLFAKPGDRVTLCRKVMGRKPGEPLVRIVDVELVSVRRERLEDISPEDVIAEGFPDSCWTPEYDVPQSDPIPGSAGVRTTRCHDCAFRPDSPERARGDDLETLDNFYCHQGIRRVVAWRHPDGRVRPEPESGAYDPPLLEVPYRADGTPADLCAGWARANA